MRLYEYCGFTDGKDKFNASAYLASEVDEAMAAKNELIVKLTAKIVSYEEVIT